MAHLQKRASMQHNLDLFIGKQRRLEGKYFSFSKLNQKSLIVQTNIPGNDSVGHRSGRFMFRGHIEFGRSEITLTK